MHLSYRGLPYQSDEQVSQFNEVEIIGQYRGLSTRIGIAESAPQTTVTLRYRGLPYNRSH
jgi:Domain of unknown function (DUF4278)